MCEQHYFDLNKFTRDDLGFWSNCTECGELVLFDVDFWEDVLALFEIDEA